MQGTHDGPFWEMAAIGNKINVYAKMEKFLTIIQLDQLVKQISGIEKVVDCDFFLLITDLFN